MTTLTGPRAAAKSGTTKSLVIFLHGYGADGNDLFGLAGPLGEHMPDTVFRSPNAPEKSAVNPMGYLYRVGRTAALRALGQPAASASTDFAGHPAQWELPNFEPNLAKFLAGLPERQRVAVWMVHGLGFSNREVAELLECSRPTVATHVRRALARLRREFGVDDD